MALPLRILLAGDGGDESSLLEKAFGPAVPEFYDLLRVANLSAALQCLTDQRFDVVLLDIALPDASSFDALLSIQNLVPDLPIIFLTNCADESVALAAMKRGAQDYLLKDQADARAIKRAIQCAIHRKQFEEVLIAQANFDGLTGLANRTLFESRLDLALARMKRKEGGLSVFFLDLNRFKQVNDTHGHAAGDRLLKEVAERLKRSVREYDTVARFGGDEFAVLIEASGLAEDYLAVAAKIIQVFEAHPFTIEKTQARIGVSIGISSCVTAGGITRDTLMKQADFAMYEAKQNPQSTFRVFGEDVTQQRRQRQLA
jgi:diguanylate cyclase (GGDEF)-like protein